MFARSVFDFASGNPVRRLSLFDHLGRSPDSSASRDLITNSSKYGLTKGSYKADQIEMTPDGATVFSDQTAPRDRARTRVKLAIESIPIFAALYRRFEDLKLPARAALLDAAREEGIPGEFLEQSIDTFVLNLKAVGLLQSLAGAERIIKTEHMLDLLPSVRPQVVIDGGSALPRSKAPMTSGDATFETTCFYVTPIGDEGTEFRKHSDLFLSHIIEPALEQFQLRVVRADQIGQAGIITRQIFDYIIRSRLVIADLSFHNPNVFYELAIRHMTKKPVVQISRIGDKIPFDINQMRTVILDNTDIYSLIPKLELYKSEIASQVRRALDGTDDVDNPISIYYPDLSMTL